MKSSRPYLAVPAALLLAGTVSPLGCAPERGCSVEANCLAEDGGPHDAGTDAGAHDAGTDGGPADGGSDSGPSAPTGTLSADRTELNQGDSTTFHWTTQGARVCVLTGPGFEHPIPIPEEDVASGHVEASVSIGGTYELRCDNDLVASVSLTVASVSIVSVSPGALGLSAEEVVVAYDYRGPSPESCHLLVNSIASSSTEEEGLFRVTLGETSELRVACEGYGDAEISSASTVEQLLTAFDGPEAPLPYGGEAVLTWETADNVTCTLNGVSPASPNEHQVTLESDASFNLECRKGDHTVAATRIVKVRPGLDSWTGTLEKNGAVYVVFRAVTTPNASKCVLEGAGGSWDMEVSGGGPGPKVFQVELTDGAQEAASYSVRCESSQNVDVVSASPVTVWWGNVDGGSLSALAASDSTLVTGDLNLTGSGISSVSGLTKVEEVGGYVDIGNTSLQNLGGLESLRRVLGALDISNNTLLREVSSGGDQGLISLEEVLGNLTVSSNTHMAFTAVSLPALEKVGGSLTIQGNSWLTTITMNGLASVGEDLTIRNNEVLSEIGMGLLDAVGRGFAIEGNWDGTLRKLVTVDFRRLRRVGEQGGNFTLRHTLLQSFREVGLHGYAPFGALEGVGNGVGGEFSVQSNPALPCAEVAEAYCELDPRPAELSLVSNSGTCPSSCP